MKPERQIKKVVSGIEARNKILNGAKQMYEAVSAVYGVGGNNAILSMPFGFDPVVTRDGVTVAKRVSSTNAGLEDRIENDGARVLYQASEKTNKTAGDGTSATVVLGYNLLAAAHQRVVAGTNAMIVKKQMDADSRVVIKYLQEHSKVATDKQLLEVAIVSSGDENVGKLVASTLKEVGVDGGVSIREQGYPTLDVEKVNGYYFDKGFYMLNQTVEYQKPLIFVTHKRLISNSDILPLLNYVVNKSDNKKLVIIGEVAGDAQNTLVANVMQGKLDAVVIPPPAYNQEGQLFMEDIAIYTGAKLFLESYNMNEVDTQHFGSADRVQVSQERSIIFGGAGDDNAITDRASQIKLLLDKEQNAHAKDGFEKRYSKLVGKIAIINVGGSTNAEMEELRFRVEDALEAVKSAMKDGILPGGATMLARASQLDISPLFKQAIVDTFTKLYDNCAEPSAHRLQQILKSPVGHGFNLRDMTDEPVDLGKQGIWDATRSVVQTVENATSAAGTLITVNVVVTEVDPRHDVQVAEQG